VAEEAAIIDNIVAAATEAAPNERNAKRFFFIKFPPRNCYVTTAVQAPPGGDR